MILLSILIPTLECRRALLARLAARLEAQLTPEVEVLIDRDAGAATIGAKRNALVDRASGCYVSMIDDDDLVSENYVEKILQSIQLSPDCIGFNSHRYENGKLIGTCVYSVACAGKSEYFDPSGQRRFFRTPGHLCPIRKEHALATKYMPWCFGEDRDFERRVLPLLKTEAFIDDPSLYDYLLISREHRRTEVVHPRRWRYERPSPRRRSIVPKELH